MHGWPSYLQSGEYEDCNIKPTEVTPEEDENFDIQTEVLKIFINQKRKVQITPLFRETSGYIKQQPPLHMERYYLESSVRGVGRLSKRARLFNIRIANFATGEG